MLDLNTADKQQPEYDDKELDRLLRQTAPAWVPPLFPRGLISRDKKEVRVADIN